MSHTPFILVSYLLSTVVLLWTAVAPIINKRSLVRQLRTRQRNMDKRS